MLGKKKLYANMGTVFCCTVLFLNAATFSMVENPGSPLEPKIADSLSLVGINPDGLNLGKTNQPSFPPVYWQPLPNQGVNEKVLAFAGSSNDLFAAGRFDQTGDGSITSLSNIIRYGNQGGALFAGRTSYVSTWIGTLLLSGDNLYIVNSYSASVGSLGGGIRVYNIRSSTYLPSPNEGFNGIVNSLAIKGKNLYVGGSFYPHADTTITDFTAITYFDTENQSWYTLSNQGLEGAVKTMVFDGNQLFVGGSFDATGDNSVKNLGNIAYYDTGAGIWYELANQGLDGNTLGGVNAIAVSGNSIFVGGDFSQTGDGSVKDLGNIARYDLLSKTWYALPGKGLNAEVHALALSGDDVYVGGEFTETADGSLKNLGGVVRYDTISNQWHPLPNRGLIHDQYDTVDTLIATEDSLFAGGKFSQTGDGALTGLGNIARLSLGILYIPLLIK